jgi:CheY-like chemotaxis protein
MIILTVDDDIEDQEIFLEAVRIIDPLTVCLKANDGIDGYEVLMDSKTYLSLDCIFLDINMPKMSGIELLVLIKKDERLKDIPVYILSTSCSPNELAKINLLGGTSLQKQSLFALTVQMLRSVIKPSVAVR